MIDFHREVVDALSAVLPTHYEMTLTASTKTPCISYMEANNYETHTGDSIGYSRLAYKVKVWANNIAVIQRYALAVDNAMRTIGFVRTSSGELYDNESAMIQKIMNYERIMCEEY